MNLSMLAVLLLAGLPLRAEILNVEVKRLTDTQYRHWLAIEKETREIAGKQYWRTEKKLEDWGVADLVQAQQDMRMAAQDLERVKAERKAFLEDISGEKDVEAADRHSGLIASGVKEAGKRRVSVEIRGRFAIIETFTDEFDSGDLTLWQ